MSSLLVACGSSSPSVPAAHEAPLDAGGLADGGAAEDVGPEDAASDGGGDADSAPAADASPGLTPEQLALGALAPSPLPPPPPDVTNRFADDDQAARFGQTLFFETRFSGKLLSVDNDGTASGLGKTGETGKVACASCHVASAGFSDTRSYHAQISLGAGWGRRRAPSLLDVGQARLLMWDGRHDTMYNQVFGPIEGPVEMNSSRLFVAEQVYALHRATYESVFGPMPDMSDTQRFPPISAAKSGCSESSVTPDAAPRCTGESHGTPGDLAEYDHMTPGDQDAVTRVVVNLGKAIGAYERNLSCGPGRFDRWVQGDEDALDDAEKRGASLFVGKAGCASCHSGPYLSDQKFHDVGLQPVLLLAAFLDANDHGAASGLALASSDLLNSKGAFSDGDDGRLPDALGATYEGAFRTPTLRCVSKRPSFFHTAQMIKLEKVVHFFNVGGDTSGYTGQSELHPLFLSNGEEADLVAFLISLDGPGPDVSLLAP